MVENPSVKDERNGSAITEDEAALYDRQIRLWGLDAQKRWALYTAVLCQSLRAGNCFFYGKKPG